MKTTCGLFIAEMLSIKQLSHLRGKVVCEENHG